ncbi:LytR/AlgR family response regulator transcription factor [Sporomusa malonica]|uniref:Two component transcriptional regulator, LytTR family n=1 Tax=Sporomusa malonica TaxID=112901 RepID=A0A1W2DKE2_9FIRM|nr:LytTR family DNA-binding domain-containing protein [Sporomusa malonica]SMC97935.1 two component transcriptional regulator, LytTR family [Sporomusa malonica]
MVNIILVDDPRCSLEELACELGSRVEIAGSFINLFEAVEKIKEMKVTGKPFSGETPETDRLKAACMRLKCASDTGTVLILAHAQSALESSKNTDVKEERLNKQIARKNPDRITLWEGERIVVVSIEKISCCFLQKGNRKVTVVAENKIYQSNYTLNAFLDKVGSERLVRCHRSFAINPDYLAEMIPGENNTMIARVAGYNREIPVSRQFSPTLRTIVGLRTRTDCKKYSTLNNL